MSGHSVSSIHVLGSWSGKGMSTASGMVEAQNNGYEAAARNHGLAVRGVAGRASSTGRIGVAAATPQEHGAAGLEVAEALQLVDAGPTHGHIAHHRLFA